MKNKSDKKKYLQRMLIVNKIQNLRSKNNRNWMDLLKLALKLDHKKASKILSQIYKDDIKIAALAKKISRIR